MLNRRCDASSREVQANLNSTREKISDECLNVSQQLCTSIKMKISILRCLLTKQSELWLIKHDTACLRHCDVTLSEKFIHLHNSVAQFLLNAYSAVM